MIKATADYFDIPVSEILGESAYNKYPVAIEVMVNLAIETLETDYNADEFSNEINRRRILLRPFKGYFSDRYGIERAEKNSFEKSKSDTDFQSKMNDILISIENGNYPIDDFEILDNVLIKYHGNATTLSISEPPIIKVGAFSYNTTLEQVTIQDGITCVAPGMFSHCENLKEVILPESVTVIGKQAFCRCEKLSSINLPSGLMEIGDSAFASCSALKNITFPDTLEKIGPYAFEHCSQLTEVQLPKDLQTIGESSFCRCTLLSNVIVSKETDIQSLAFDHTPWFEQKVKQDGYMISGPRLLAVSSDLTEFVIPENITDIADFAFYKSKIRKIVIPSSVITIGYANFEKSLIEELQLDCNIERIPSYFCSECKNMKSLTLPNSVRCIEEDAFSNNKNVIITIPNQVEFIDDGAFLSQESKFKKMLHKLKRDKNLTIRAYHDSITEEYAEENDIPFIPID